MPLKCKSASHTFKLRIAPESMHRRFVDYTSSLFQEGFLDNQFTQLYQLQDESNPEFVVDVLSFFFENSEKILNDLSKTLDQHPIDFRKADAYGHQFKGSTASIGAHRVKNVCITFRLCCEEQNKEGCLQYLQQVKDEYYLVKNKLEALLRLEHQILEVGGTIPMVENQGMFVGSHLSSRPLPPQSLVSGDEMIHILPCIPLVGNNLVTLKSRYNSLHASPKHKPDQKRYTFYIVREIWPVEQLQSL